MYEGPLWCVFDRDCAKARLHLHMTELNRLNAWVTDRAET